MKAISDVKTNLLVQGLLTLIGKKAPSNHNHDGVYSNGARRSYNSGKQEPGTITVYVESKEEKFYIVQIGDTEDATACTTLVIDWQMINDDASQLETFCYRLGGHGGSDGTKAPVDGRLRVSKKVDTGGPIFVVDPTNSTHYIKRICGYI